MWQIFLNYIANNTITPYFRPNNPTAKSFILFSFFIITILAWYKLTCIKTETGRFPETHRNAYRGFVKMRDQKDKKINEKGVNWVEKQSENLFKMLKIC